MLSRHSRANNFLGWLLKPFNRQSDGHQPDFILLVTAGIIIFFGLLMLSSATSVISFNQHNQDSYYFIKQQIFRGFLPGLLAYIFIVRINFEKLKHFNWFWLLATIGLLVLVFLPGIGTTYNGAASWINIAGVSVQTSELAKLTFIIYLAIWFEAKQKELKNFKTGLLPFLILLGIVSLLIMLQPDMGTMLIFISFSIIMFMVAGMTWKQFLVSASLGFVAVFAMVKAAPYRIARFVSFINPDADPQGAGYQLKQALIAIGSGGFLGLGLGHSRQKFAYLPEVAADSIFAVVAEEWGFIFTTLFVVLYLILFFRGVSIARRSPSMFGKLLATGITSWIIVQAAVNIGAIIGILPLTGLPLPFVSLGGSNLAVVMMALAILTNISKYTKDTGN